MNATNLNSHLLQLINKIKGEANFFATGKAEFFIPQLIIKNIGEVSFPLHATMAKEIIAHAKQAPFGKGSKTIVDTNVRNTWEINPEDVTIKEPRWKKQLQKFVSETKLALGIEDGEIKADFYKLLIYEEGSFFLKHQDTEREKGMFGTLVITLPSQYEGGEFELYFDGNKETIDHTNNLYNYNYVAFYADCQHAILPIKKGYRMALVYNLVKINSQNIPTPFIASAQIAEIYNFLKPFDISSVPLPLAIMLNHQYTPESFSLNALKSSDLVEVNVLKHVAEKLGWYFNVGLLSHYMSGSLNYGDDDADYDDVEYVNDESTDLVKFCMQAYPSIEGLDTKYIQFINPKNYNDEDPYEKENDGYMGNYGPDVDFYYHHAIVIFGPYQSLISNIVYSTNQSKFGWINHFLKNPQANAPNIIEILKTLHLNEHENIGEHADAIVTLLQQKLINLNDDPKFHQIIIAYFSSFSTSKIFILFNLLPVNELKPLVKAIFSQAKFKNLKIAIETLTSFYLDTKLTNKEKIAILETETLASLTSFFIPTQNNYVSAEDEITIIKKLLLWNEADNSNTTTIIKIFETVINRKLIYDCLLKVIVLPNQKNKLQTALKNLTILTLEKFTEQKPLPAQDYKRDFPNKINPIKIEQTLKNFCENAHEPVFELRALQDLRKSYEATINSLNLDITCTTIKTGSPHLLVMAKNNKSYYKKMELYKKDLEWLQKFK